MGQLPGLGMVLRPDYKRKKRKTVIGTALAHASQRHSENEAEVWILKDLPNYVAVGNNQ
jgi:hypothetical protein